MTNQAPRHLVTLEVLLPGYAPPTTYSTMYHLTACLDVARTSSQPCLPARSQVGPLLEADHAMFSAGPHPHSAPASAPDLHAGAAPARQPPAGVAAEDGAAEGGGCRGARDGARGPGGAPAAAGRVPFSQNQGQMVLLTNDVPPTARMQAHVAKQEVFSSALYACSCASTRVGCLACARTHSLPYAERQSITVRLAQ